MGLSGQAGDEARARAIIRATDVLLTLAVYEVRAGWACRAKPKWERRRRCPPTPVRRRFFLNSAGCERRRGDAAAEQDANDYREAASRG
jgi:hypothetical protein